MGYQTDSSKCETEASTIARLAKTATEIQPFKVGEVEVFRNPATGDITALEKFRLLPHRQVVDLDLADSGSFIKAVHHYDGTPRVVHFSIASLTVACILNHSKGTDPNWHDSKLEWKLKRDPYLSLWLEKADKWLSQDQLMEHLEERIDDVVQNTNPTKNLPVGPSQSELLSVVSDLRITTDATFTSRKDLHNGNYVFESSKQDKPSVEVPAMFYVGLPFFDGAGDHFIFPIRLRYRLSNGKLTFQLSFHNFRKIQDTAWEGVQAGITAALGDDIPHFNVL